MLAQCSDMRAPFPSLGKSEPGPSEVHPLSEGGPCGSQKQVTPQTWKEGQV